ncbi:PAS domain S-box-containing protein/diguanylate cyclase (GGDEF) domain-containing protein [Alteromonadaceae bacterium Bs31]|nr:PAS domain S-box-containing protein/diguanylate cyclase (GGDEF) domain-containing protein [Alteromonadaceae bacterium Bs31]
MLDLAEQLHLVAEALTILAALVLLLVFVLRKEQLKVQGFDRGFNYILLGTSFAAISAALSIAVLAFPSLSATIKNVAIWIPLVYSVGGILVFVGLAVLINQVIPKSSQKMSELVAIREELAASNDELAQTIAKRNQELEINNMTLRQVLEDQRTSRVALLHSEKKFRTLFDESPAIFVTLNNVHTITDINLYGAKSLGYDPVSLVGQAFSKVVSLEDADHQMEFIDFCFNNSNEKLETELRLIRNNTKKLWVKVSGSIIEEDKKNVHLLLVCQDITESKKLAETLSYQAKHDDWTGLYNRRAFEAFLNDDIATLSSLSRPTALLYIDIDQLKVVNDTCGHGAGDEYLRQLVLIINEHSKSFDFFARTGGDEFAIVITKTSARKARDVAEVIRNAAEDYTFQWEGHSFRQSISVGIALTSQKIRSFTDIFAAADVACFQAKNNGRNCVVVHKDASDDFGGNRGEMLWVSRLQNALLNDRFELYFQPIVCLKDVHNGYIHYEVLIRYVDDEGTHISPDAFLPAAERYGLSSQIDLWVLTTTLFHLDSNPQHTEALGCCSINLSSLSLSSHQTRSAIKQLVMTASFPATKLCFEITETAAIHKLEEVVDFINELKTLGCKFALDDFGTGFSSFGYLRRLEIDYIKIDGSFIRDITNDKLGRAMVKAMSSIGKEMGIATIAEYVENLHICHELQNMEVPYGQGFGLAKPMPIEKTKEYYALSEQNKHKP